jgi:hypothetical protein
MRLNVRQKRGLVQPDVRRWYYVDGAHRVGPVATEDLRAALLRGALTADSLVWTAGMADWSPAATALAPADSSGGGRLATQATLSLVLGILSVVGLFVFITIPAAIAGLILGIKALRSSHQGQAIAGIILSSLGLLISVLALVGLARAIAVVGWDQIVAQFLSSLP